ncbi:MAG: hypothetical protein ABI415_11955 [Flavitalea sp.]
MVFDKLFAWAKKKEVDPAIPFGRYSDNNKTVAKVESWTRADAFFREKKYKESVLAFFDYLSDEDERNVELEEADGFTSFRVYQGSKVVRGKFNEEKLEAKVTLAVMPEASIPLMRRLLEMNFNLYYSRYTLCEDKVCMLFNTDLTGATPNKLYYGLKELATKADKQDDLLINEFGFLKPIDSEHIAEIPEAERAVKFDILQNWIMLTLDYISTLDADKFSGAISYLLLTLVFRIDYMICPQGKLLYELEKIASAYYTNEDKSSPARNPDMIDGLNKLLLKSREDVYTQMFRARYTFAIVVPHNIKLVSEAIETALQNMVWYRDNGYPDIANKVMEYGFAFSQYSYSLPKPLTDLYFLFSQINYAEYFRALGFSCLLFDENSNRFEADEISERIETIIDYWKAKYPSFSFKTKKLKFDTLLNFNHTFLQEVAELNFE